jgi:hypothetical protein
MIFQNSQEQTRPQFGQSLFEHTAPVKSHGQATQCSTQVFTLLIVYNDLRYGFRQFELCVDLLNLCCLLLQTGGKGFDFRLLGFTFSTSSATKPNRGTAVGSSALAGPRH